MGLGVVFDAEVPVFEGRHCFGADLTAGRLSHSDRGSQYDDGDYLDALGAAGIERSMSRTGNCYDNAAMESFWSTLKSGLDEAIPVSRNHTELATPSLPSSTVSRLCATLRDATARSDLPRLYLNTNTLSNNTTA